MKGVSRKKNLSVPGKGFQNKLPVILFHFSSSKTHGHPYIYGSVPRKTVSEGHFLSEMFQSLVKCLKLLVRLKQSLQESREESFADTELFLPFKSLYFGTKMRHPTAHAVLPKPEKEPSPFPLHLTRPSSSFTPFRKKKQPTHLPK